MNMIAPQPVLQTGHRSLAEPRRGPAPHSLSRAFTLAAPAEPAGSSAPVRDPAKIAAIKAKYDPSSISPRQIDQMMDELHAAGAGFDEGTTMLITQGERFRSHIARELGQDVGFDPTRKINLIETSRGQMEFARRHGDDITPWLDMLDLFEHPAPAPASAPPNWVLQFEATADGRG